MEQDWQQKYQEFQQLQQQIEQISHHLQLLSQQSVELENSATALDDLQQVKKDTEILAPIANGVFIKNKLDDNQRVVVNVGADISVEKTIPQMLDLLNIQKEEISSQLIQGDKYLQELQQKAMVIYQQVQQVE